MNNLINLLNETIQFFDYSLKKRFVKKYEENPKNYDKRTPPTLLATSEYLDAVADISVYDYLLFHRLNESKSNITTSVGKINLATGKKTPLKKIE